MWHGLHDSPFCTTAHFARQSKALVVSPRPWYLKDHGFCEPRVYKYSRGSCFPAHLQNPNFTDSQIFDTKTQLWKEVWTEKQLGKLGQRCQWRVVARYIPSINNAEVNQGFPQVVGLVFSLYLLLEYKALTPPRFQPGCTE